MCIRDMIKTKFLYPLAYLNELYSRINKYREPMLTVNGLRMSEELMFFSSEKAKSQLGYRPRNINNAIKDAVPACTHFFSRIGACAAAALAGERRSVGQDRSAVEVSHTDGKLGGRTVILFNPWGHRTISRIRPRLSLRGSIRMGGRPVH